MNFPDKVASSAAAAVGMSVAAPAAGAADGASVAAVAMEVPDYKNSSPPAAEGVSVYESILPASISYRPTVITTIASPAKTDANADGGKKPAAGSSNSTTVYAGIMPLVAHLREGAMNRPVGWHRNDERLARGLWPVSSLSTQLEA